MIFLIIPFCFLRCLMKTMAPPMMMATNRRVPMTDPTMTPV